MSKTWANTLNTLKDEIDLAQFSVWIQPLKVTEDKNNLSIFTPNASALNYINKNLKSKIESAVAKHNQSVKVHIVSAPQASNSKQAVQQHLTPLFSDYTFDNLVLGNANQIAYGATRQIAENIEQSPYNPFIIYGGSGLGKTHLMQAAGHLAKEKNPSAKIIYAPLMDFVKNITASLRHNTIDKIKQYYQSADLLLVDDIHLIAGKEKSQEEFFHIFNFLFNTNKQIIFTCDQIPNHINALEDRLKTRFSQGLSLQLTPPELEMRAAILLKKSQSKKFNLNLSDDMALFIAGHITSNVRDLEGALLKLKAFVDFSRIDQALMSKEVIESALGDLIKPSLKNIDINDIQKQVAKHYLLTVSDLTSKNRKRPIVMARQMAMFIAHELTNLSLANIGKNFGNRDHSTVLHAIKTINNNIDKTSEIKNNYESIKLKLASL